MANAFWGWFKLGLLAGAFMLCFFAYKWAKTKFKKWGLL